jgi:hypothetical protein
MFEAPLAESDPFSELSLAKRQIDRLFLTEKEILTISTKVFPTDRLSIVRDIFILIVLPD